MDSVLNSSISVDCVVFGFDGQSLRVLLVKRTTEANDYKLPGSMIYENEDVDNSANRVLQAFTGMDNVYLKQLHLFSDPKRIYDKEDLEWMHKTYGIQTQRIVTIAYYSLIKLTPELFEYTSRNGAFWCDTYSIKKLAFDHKDILLQALETLYQQFVVTPIVFELLPVKFTIRQIQDIYEKVLDIEIDNRNFRKKLFTYSYLVPINEKECGVKHKPAQLYTFDKKKYERVKNKRNRQNIIKW